MTEFMFATGIENSYPTIAGGVRVDEMDKCGHYARWREDLSLPGTRIPEFLEIEGIRLAGRAPGRNRLEWPLGGWDRLQGAGEVTITPSRGCIAPRYFESTSTGTTVRSWHSE